MGVELAKALQSLECGSFVPAPAYDANCDRLRLITENRRAYRHFVNRYLSLYLAMDDDSLIGVQIDHFSQVCKAIDGLGEVPLSKTVEMTNGETIEVALAVRIAAFDAKLDGERYEQVNRVTEGIYCHKPKGNHPGASMQPAGG